MKKKIITLTLMITMVLCTSIFIHAKNVSAIVVGLVATEKSGGVTYECYSDGYAVASADLAVTGSAIVIQSTCISGANTYPVTVIKDNGFSNLTDLTEVTIPDSVKSIEDGAFYNCSNLKTITIGTGVDKSELLTIGGSAFAKCAMSNIALPNKLTTLEAYAFFYCPSLISITIPDSVTTMGDMMFRICNSLESVTIGDGVTTIYDYSFAYLDSIKTVVFGNGVTSIGDSVFEESPTLESVTLGSKVETIGGRAFYGCNMLTTIVIPDSVKSIGGNAFGGCLSITTLSLGGIETSNLVSIGDYAFQWCVGITEIKIPNKVETIGDSAFYKCEKATEITLGSDATASNLTSIGDLAFDGCIAAVNNVAIPNKVTYIGNGAFESCSKLNVSIGTSSMLTSIGASAFYDCAMITSMYIPVGVSSIGVQAFDGCSALSEITVAPGNVSFIIDIGGALLDYGKTILIQYPVAKASAPYVIPSTVTTINGGAFRSSKISGDITISASITAIGDQAFYGCSKITNFVVDSANLYYSDLNGALCDKAVTELLQYPLGNTAVAFEVPASVTYINDGAFKELVYLTDINVNSLNTDYYSISGVLFMNFYGKALIVYPSAKIQSIYHIPEGTEWIFDDAIYNCKNLKGIVLAESVLLFKSNFIGTDLILYVTQDYVDNNSKILTEYNYADISEIPYDVTVKTMTNGSITSDISLAVPGTTVTLTIIPASGYQLKSGSLNYNDGTQVVAITGASFTLPAANVTISAEFVFNGTNSGNNTNNNGNNTVETDSDLPKIEGSKAEGWDAIIKNLADNSTGNVIVNMNGSTVVKSDIFEAIQGKDTNVTFVLKNGFEWVINGMDIPEGADTSQFNNIDLNLSLDTSNIPKELLNDINEKDRVQISLAYDGSFGFSATLRIPLEESNSGQYANLYYYNPVTKQLEFRSVSQINSDGDVEFLFTHASDYVVIISKEPMLGDQMEQIKVTPDNKTLYIGGTKGTSVMLKSVLPESIQEAVLDGLCKVSITYKSSNSKVAIVSKAGVVVAKKVGTTTITTTVIVNGIVKTFQTKIKVVKAYIALVQSKDTMKLGETFTFQMIGYGINTKGLIFNTSNESIVVINKTTGKAKAVSTGTDYVIATVGSIRVKVKVVVK